MQDLTPPSARDHPEACWHFVGPNKPSAAQQPLAQSIPGFLALVFHMAHKHPHPRPHQHQHQHPGGGPTQSGAQPGHIQVNPPDPSVVAAIDAQFRPVDLKLGGDDGNSIVLCAPHGLETCTECGTDFLLLNQTSRVLKQFPKEMPVPPPPNVVHPQRSPLVQKAKEEGNVRSR